MKILHLDIETAPHQAFVWGLFQQNVGINQLAKPGYTLCWSAKWHGRKPVLSAWHTDRHNLAALHQMMEEADAICTYNGQKFDIPTLNREFLLQGLTPPAPAKQIDLYQTVKSRFRFASNKLDFVCQQLGLGSKVVHRGFDLWRDCMDEKPPAKREMLSYNKGDVVLLEALYNKLRPWIRNHPSASLDGGCVRCGSHSLQKRGTVQLAAGVYQRYQCTDCGHWSRDAVNLLTRPTTHIKRGL